MDLTARGALLLALASGPGFGLDLIDRVTSRSGGRARVSRGGTSLALRGIERDGLARVWVQRLGNAGRPRRYYELTPTGILRVESLSRSLRSLLGIGERAAAIDAPAMVERLVEASALSASAQMFRDAGRGAGL